MNNIRTLVTQFVEKKSMMDALKKETEALKAEIMKFHAGRDLVSEAGIESKIIHGTRSTINKSAIEKLLGHEIPSECYTYTQYDQLKCKIVAA